MNKIHEYILHELCQTNLFKLTDSGMNAAAHLLYTNIIRKDIQSIILE